MNSIYLYADEASLEVLLDERQKALLVGSDFGYGNFGDVLQHLNSARFVKELGRYATVSVFAANAIEFAGFPSWARSAYGSDAIVYVADYPLLLDENSPKLKLVGEIRNLAVVYLYGGGFLNDMWGDYVLSVTEFFLRLAPDIGYLVSGQQVTSPYHTKVVEHIKNFQPRLFGVRDVFSQQRLQDVGFVSHFSFDDATEALLALRDRVGLKADSGLLLHLNASDYTVSTSARNGAQFELERLRTMDVAREGVTLFQAFRDARQEVIDSTETVKRLGARFPFYDLRVIDLVGLIFDENAGDSMRSITGSIGFSSSYHVALWLQLSGIPCWLRSNNAFYDQKSKALQVTQGLDEFINDPKLANHEINLERRAGWRKLLGRELSSWPDVRNLCRVLEPQNGPAPWPFFFKGTPTLQEKLTQAECDRNYFYERDQSCSEELKRSKDEIQGLHECIDSLTAQLEDVSDAECFQQQRADTAEADLSHSKAELFALSERNSAVSAQLTEVGHEAHFQRRRAEIAESELNHVKAENFELNERNSAVSAQLTEVGHEAHLQRKRADAAEVCVAQVKLEAGLLESQLMASEADRKQMLASRSWWLTRPIRAIARFVRSGRFDSRGEVGLFAVLQRSARHLPISSGVRNKLGRILQKMRRR